MRNRIKDLRLERGISQGDLARQLHVAQGMVSYWERGTYDAPPGILMELARIFDVSVDYLIYNDSVKRRQSVSSFGNVLPISTKKVPLLGAIACGEPIYASEEHGEFAVVWSNIDCDFCVRAQGDSMVGARINDGDLVFCKQADIVDNGRIAAVIIDGNTATLKRFYYDREREHIVLAAENPAYAPLIYDGARISEVRVLGEAVAFQSIVK